MKTCKQCGAEVLSDSPEGLCARCLLSVAMKESAAAPAAPLAGEPTIKSPAGQSPASPAVSPPVAAGDFPDIGDPADVARRLPQFEILELLGRGGMGVVYKAVQRQIDRTVALKILPPLDARSPDFVERFRREARSLARLSHPNIVTLYEFGETGGLYYFVMEFVDGVNLREMIRTGKMKPEEALAVVPKICDALQFAHEEGVVHRDVKPENILIDKRGRVKIADFGLAKILRREQADHTLTATGMTLGTPRYMAPEQLDKPETVDHRADIYSLGVVFYEMLTGEVPMGRFAPPSQKVQVDVRLDEIVLHAMERDVERRYQHASELRTDVENVTSKPQAAPTAPAPASGPAANGALLLLDETDRRVRHHQHFFFFAGLFSIVAGFGLALVLCLLGKYGFLPLAIAFCAAGVGQLSSVAARARQQWEIEYFGHSVRFENGIFTSGVLLIDGKSMAAGGIGPHTELSARILNGPGAGDRIVVKTHATLAFLRCQIFAEPKGSSPAISPQVSAAIPAAEAPTPPAALHPLPRFFHLRFFILLLLGWGAVLALWNFGPVGVLAGATIQAAIILEAARAYALRYPSWVEKLRARSFGLRFFLVSFNLFTLILVLVIFIGGLFMLWDGADLQAGFNGRTAEAGFNGRTAEEFEANYRGKEYQLIRYLAAFKEQVPTVEMVTDFVSSSSDAPTLRVLGWIFIGYALLSIFFMFHQAGGEQRSMWMPNRGRWGPAFAATGIFLASLFCVLIALLWIAMERQPGHYLKTANVSFNSQATVAQASDALRQWAAENGYASARHRWSLQTVPKGETAASVEVFSAWKDSPFDRWQMTTSGPQRPYPHLEMQLTGTEKPLETEISITSGIDRASLIELNSDKAKRWDAIVKSAMEAVRARGPKIDTKDLSPLPPVAKGTGEPPSWPAIGAVLAAALLWAFVRIRFGALSTAPSISMGKAEIAFAGAMLLLGSLLGSKTERQPGVEPPRQAASVPTPSETPKQDRNASVTPPASAATEFLRKASEQYASLTSFSASGKIVSVGTSAAGGATFTVEHTFSINLARPDYYRIEWTSKTGGSITNSGTTWFAGDGHKELMNGKVITLLNRETALAAATGVSGGAAHTVPSLFFRDPRSALQERFTNATLLPDEDLNGEACHVVTAESQDGSKWTFWIRKKDLFLQQRYTSPATVARREMDPETIRKIAEGTGKLLKAAGQDFSPEDLKNHLEAAQQRAHSTPTQFTTTETFEHIVVDDLMLKDDFEVKVPDAPPAPKSP